MSKILMISSDCHAGALPGHYADYMPKKYHEAATAWWLVYAREMMLRSGTFFDQEAVEAYASDAGEGGGRMKAMTTPETPRPRPPRQPSDIKHFWFSTTREVQAGRPFAALVMIEHEAVAVTAQ